MGQDLPRRGSDPVSAPCPDTGFAPGAGPGPGPGPGGHRSPATRTRSVGLLRIRHPPPDQFLDPGREQAPVGVLTGQTGDGRRTLDPDTHR